MLMLFLSAVPTPGWRGFLLLAVAADAAPREGTMRTCTAAAPCALSPQQHLLLLLPYLVAVSLQQLFVLLLLLLLCVPPASTRRWNGGMQQ